MITQYLFNDIPTGKSKNTIDIYKSWMEKEIRADLDKRRTESILIFSNFQHNLNIACGIRSNNAFLGKSVYVIGKRRYDKRGSVGCHHYENVYHADTLQEVTEYLHSLGYTIYAVDNIMEYNPVNLFDEKLPKKSAFVFGEEGTGLSKEEIEMCDKMLYIGMYGSVRSLNVASAATVVEYEYSKQWR